MLDNGVEISLDQMPTAQTTLTTVQKMAVLQRGTSTLHSKISRMTHTPLRPALDSEAAILNLEDEEKLAWIESSQQRSARLSGTYA